MKHPINDIEQGVKLIFTRGHISITVAFKGRNVILGLYKCDYSLARGKELYIRPFEGNSEADVAPGENDFDTFDAVFNCRLETMYSKFLHTT